MKKSILGIATVVATSTLLLAGCSAGGSGNSSSSSASASSGGGAKAVSKRACVILPDTESSPRWENGDRPALNKAFTDAGFTADIQNAHNSTTKYATIATSELSKGCGVMLLVDLNGAGAQVLTKAKAQGVPVIAYDRPIAGADYYVSFDNEKVGELEGQMIVDGLKAEKQGPEDGEASSTWAVTRPTATPSVFHDGATDASWAPRASSARSPPKGTWDGDEVRHQVRAGATPR